MKRYLFLFLFTIYCFTLHAQTWKPKYSVANMLDWSLHRYNDYEHNNPWAVAEELFRNDNWLIDGYDEMKIDVNGVFISNNYAQIATNSLIFNFYSILNSPSTMTYIVIEQKNSAVIGPISTGTRTLATIYFKSNATDLCYFGKINTNCEKYAGYIKINFQNGVQIRINADGVMMIKRPNPNPNINKIECALNFIPAYKQTSPRIPNEKSGWNKPDVSHLLMDEYGGIGVYLLDYEKEYYYTSSDKPTLTYDLPTTEKIFWVAAFPPKSYNYDKTRKGKSMYAGLTREHTYLQTGGTTSWRQCVYNWTDTMANPMSSYFFVNDNKNNALRTFLNNSDSSVTANGGYFIHHDPLTLWKDWLYSYIPRAYCSQPYDLLDLIRENVKGELAPRDYFGDLIGENVKDKSTTRNKLGYIVYTSPQYFIKGSSYSPTTSPYERWNIDPCANTYNNSTFYDTNCWQGYTMHNGEKFKWYKGKEISLPIINNWDFLTNNPNENFAIDKLYNKMGIDFTFSYYPMNREGENYSAYIEAVAALYGHVDGIFMDTPYEFNMPRMYQLMRKLRNDPRTRNFKLFLHESARAGQDAYLPQIDAYADYIVNGEGNKNNEFYDRMLWRYFICTVNISNTPSLILTPENIAKQNQTTRNEFILWCTDYDIQMMYPVYRLKSLNTDYNSQVSFVKDFYSYYDLLDASSMATRLKNNFSFHQGSLQSQYNSLGYNIEKDLTDGILFAGDFDNSGKERVVTYNLSSKTWNFDDGTFIQMGSGDCIPFISDFNADGKSDLSVCQYNLTQINFLINFSKAETIGSGGENYNFTATKTFTMPSVSTNFPFSTTNLKILSMDINNDFKEDMVVIGNIKGKGSIGCYIPYLSGETINDINFGFNPVWQRVPFNISNSIFRARLTDSSHYLTTVNGNNWDYYSVTSKSLNELKVEEMLDYSFGNPTDKPFIGDFDGNGTDDLGITRLISNSLTNYYCLTGGNINEDYFVPDAYFNSFANCNSNFSPIALDYNGDGFDDMGYYDPDDYKLIIRFNKPGQIFSASVIDYYKSNGEEVLPYATELQQNFPNPFNPTTTINFSLNKPSRVTLTVYNILGQKVSTLIDNKLDAGKHSANFDGLRLSSGVYIYTLKTDEVSLSKKMLLLK